MDSGSADFWVGAEQCAEAQEQAAGGVAGNANVASDGHRRRGGSGAVQAKAAAAAAKRANSGAGAGAQSCGNHSFLGTQSSTSFVDSGAPSLSPTGRAQLLGPLSTTTSTWPGLR